MSKPPFKEKTADIHARNIVTLKERIKNKLLSGVYLFYGDEEYTKNYYCREITNAAGEMLNVTSFYGEDFELTEFIAACETNAIESFDMFSAMDGDESEENGSDSIRVIKLFNPDLSGLSKKDSEYFEQFLSEPPENTVIIFHLYSGQEEALSKGIYKKITELALTVNFKREPASSTVLITWILRHFSKEKLNCDRYVAVHLCQTVGNSMTDLKNEIDKVIDFLRFENRDTVTKEDVDFICIKSAEAQIFDISSGAMSGNFTKAAKALEVLRDKKENPILILGTIAKAMRDICVTENYIKNGVSIPAISKEEKIPEFIVRNNAEILNNRKHDFHGNDSFTLTASKLITEYDKKLKSSRTDGYELLLELIFKISFAGKV